MSKTNFRGSGDSYLIKDVLPAEIAKCVYQKIVEEVDFKDLMVNGKSIGREGAFYAQIGNNGEVPILRCPSIEGAEVQQFTPMLQIIRDCLHDKTGIDINHVKVQTYADNTKGVEPHTDKTLDLVPNTAIINYRIGETREFILTNKVDGTQQIIDMPHNSVFVLGPKTNIEWLHSVEPKEETLGPSISMVFRQAGTFQRPDGHFFGVGARLKTQQELDNYLSDKNSNQSQILSESIRRKNMISGYIQENRNNFDCREKVYRKIIENTV